MDYYQNYIKPSHAAISLCTHAHDASEGTVSRGSDLASGQLDPAGSRRGVAPPRCGLLPAACAAAPHAPGMWLYSACCSPFLLLLFLVPCRPDEIWGIHTWRASSGTTSSLPRCSICVYVCVCVVLWSLLLSPSPCFPFPRRFAFFFFLSYSCFDNDEITS